MKAGKKNQRKLERRQVGFRNLESDVKAMGRSFNAAAYTCPGSRNPRKPSPAGRKIR